MGSPEYKRRKNDARSKFRKLWREKNAFNDGRDVAKEWESPTNSFNLSDSKEFPSLNGEAPVKKVHVPKNKYAIAFGFLGTSYHGYQKQMDYKTGIMDKVKTVEGTIESCLFKIGVIHESFRNMTYRLQMSKSSRTDKGVHAACTYIGGRFNLDFYDDDKPDDKLSVDLDNSQSTEDYSADSEMTFDTEPDLSDANLDTQVLMSNASDSTRDDSNLEIALSDGELSKEERFIQRINSILPDDIRCFKIQRVTRGFDARSMCSKRKYEYVMPEWMLRKGYTLPDEEHVELFNRIEAFFAENLNTKESIRLKKADERLYEARGVYAEREMGLERFTALLKLYEGTHDFHNFTVRNKLENQKTQRYIHKITVKQDKLEDLDVLKIMIVGQSFLYNQIRKMISLALQVYLNIAPQNALEYALNKAHFLNINIVPSEGLILHHPYFEGYNVTRCTMANVPFIEYSDVKPEVELFKTRYIYPEIKRSIDSSLWEGWLENILKFPFYLENQLAPGGESVPNMSTETV